MASPSRRLASRYGSGGDGLRQVAAGRRRRRWLKPDRDGARKASANGRLGYVAFDHVKTDLNLTGGEARRLVGDCRYQEVRKAERIARPGNRAGYPFRRSCRWAADMVGVRFMQTRIHEFRDHARLFRLSEPPRWLSRRSTIYNSSTSHGGIAGILLRALRSSDPAERPAGI